MIIDRHMHVGEFPDFGVRLEADSLGKHLTAHKIDVGLVLPPGNAMVYYIGPMVARLGGVGLSWIADFLAAGLAHPTFTAWVGVPDAQQITISGHS